ncbi:MAG TPA: hypothetical protein VKI44_26405 [Acetobacteraceae bacterium]|nr:hypothetical protein [Acetobacteraceae bacterium]
MNRLAVPLRAYWFAASLMLMSMAVRAAFAAGARMQRIVDARWGGPRGSLALTQGRRQSGSQHMQQDERGLLMQPKRRLN